MDYAHQTRLKLLGRACVVEDDPKLISRLIMEGYPAKVERAVLIDVEGFDWNCPRHIPQMFPRDAVEQALGTLEKRIATLERENAELRKAPP